jgi:branched-chain amino acid transport system substrate-binding protein
MGVSSDSIKYNDRGGGLNRDEGSKQILRPLCTKPAIHLACSLALVQVDKLTGLRKPGVNVIHKAVFGRKERMAQLHATLVTPLTGPLSLFGRASAVALAIWAKKAANLPSPWTSVDLDVQNTGEDICAAMQAALATQPDVLFGPYGSGPMLGAARACERVLWNHGGASSRLARPAFPQVINVLAPASTYFSGVLEAAHTFAPTIKKVSLFHSTTGFGKEVARSATTTAASLQLDLQSVAFVPSQARAAVPTVPDGDVLLVVGNFADELAVASRLLARPWRFAAFVGAGVEEVLATLGHQREGLLGPVQWLRTADIEPDEGPGVDWFVEAYREEEGIDPPYAAAQAFAAGILYARCLRDVKETSDTAIQAAAQMLKCTTLYGKFQLDSSSGLQSGHHVLIVQWQQEQRHVVWPPEQAKRPVLFPLPS